MMRSVVLACVLGMFSGGDLQEDRDQAIRLATDALSRVLKVGPDKIQLVSAEAVDWPNSSLGCPKSDMAYLPVIVPGFRVRLAVGDRQHAVHTGSGRAIVCDDAARGTPSSESGGLTPPLAAADRARRHLATELHVKAEDIIVGRVDPWRSSERACDPPKGTTIEGDTFSVELKRGTKTYRYRATAQVAWACK